MRRSKLTIVLLSLLIVASLVFGCTSSPGDGGQALDQENLNNINSIEESTIYPLNITDGLGNSVTIEKEPESLVSIDPSQTEVLFALGLGDRLVGVSNFCDYPEEALEKEKVGDAFAINVEKILELNPDLVFIYGGGQAEAVEQLRASGISIVSNIPETTDEIFATILQTGRLMNVENKAEQVVNELKERKDKIVNQVKDREKVRVFYELWDEPLMTAGEGSFIDELINLAGGENIGADGQGAYPEYSLEAMIEKDPQVYILPAHMEDKQDLNDQDLEELKNTVKSRPAYETISAVKNDRIEMLEPNIVSRPGIRIIEALELFARAIHPEVF